MTLSLPKSEKLYLDDESFNRLLMRALLLNVVWKSFFNFNTGGDALVVENLV
jgi:hypothetical protein